MSDSQINEIEVSIERAKEMIERSESLNWLLNNKQFNDVILKGYFEKEACRLVLSKAEPILQTDEHQRDIIKSIDGIGSLRSYFTTTFHSGDMARKSIADDRVTREELEKEEDS